MSVDPAQVLEQAKKHLRGRNYERAIELLDEGIAADVDNAELHECVATASFLKGDLERARDEFITVTRLKPVSGAAWINLGAVYNRMGDFKGASNALRKGVQRDKKSSQGYYNLGIAQKGLNQLSMAASAYREAIKINPQMAEAHQNLGNVYLEMSNNRQAVLCFRKALEIRPDFARAKRGLALAENAIEESKKDTSPFGRLVTQEDLAAQKQRSVLRELTPEEREEDRRLVRVHTSAVRTSAQELAVLLREKLEPAILGLNRAVSNADTSRDLSRPFELFRDTLEAAKKVRTQLRAGVTELREHDQEMRSGKANEKAAG